MVLAMSERLDDLRVRDWSPLTNRELQSLNCIKPGKGKVEVSRHLLARLLQERDRLFYATEAARWLCEEAHAEGVVEERPARTDDRDLDRAAAVMRHALTVVVGISFGVPPAD